MFTFVLFHCFYVLCMKYHICLANLKSFNHNLNFNELRSVKEITFNRMICFLCSLTKYAVNPGAKERLVQITGPSEEKIK